MIDSYMIHGLVELDLLSVFQCVTLRVTPGKDSEDATKELIDLMESERVSFNPHLQYSEEEASALIQENCKKLFAYLCRKIAAPSSVNISLPKVPFQRIQSILQNEPSFTDLLEAYEE